MLIDFVPSLEILPLKFVVLSFELHDLIVDLINVGLVSSAPLQVIIDVELRPFGSIHPLAVLYRYLSLFVFLFGNFLLQILHSRL
jgi:hypothetical protein